MQCPVCENMRLEPGELADDLVAHNCAGCGGHFVQSERYLKWLRRHGDEPDEDEAGGATSLAVSDSGPGKLCPKCGAFLICHVVGSEAPFRIDRCGRCGGIWLDGNEWQLLRARNLHVMIHQIFSEAWQKREKHRERARQYGETVTHLLDDEIARVCGSGDLERLKQLKAWLDEHPHSRRLYEYLRATRDLASQPDPPASCESDPVGSGGGRRVE